MPLSRMLSLRIVGSLSLLFGCLGLLLTANAWVSNAGRASMGAAEARLVLSLVVMLALACYVGLGIVGVQLLRLKGQWERLLSFVLVAELVLFFGVGIAAPLFGKEVAEALGGGVGFACDGMILQFACAFPVWAPRMVRAG